MRYKMEPTDIFIITAEKYQQLTMKEIPEIPKEKDLILAVTYTYVKFFCQPLIYPIN